MKQIVLTLLCAFAFFSAGISQAQVNYETDDFLCDQCQQVALDKYWKNGLLIPAFKLAYWCSFSKECFFVTDEVPEDAIIYDIEEIKNRRTGVYLPANYVVNIDSLNYFGYTFGTVQQRPGHWAKTIYYRTPGSAHAYLAVRSYGDAQDRINNDVLARRYLGMEDIYCGENK